MTEFFYGYTELELHMNEEALTRYQDIASVGFSSCPYVKSQLATAYYNMRGTVACSHCVSLLELVSYFKFLRNT